MDMKMNRWKWNGWTVCAIALFFFAAGSMITARFAHAREVRADGDRVFELRIYHALPGKLPALEARFRDTTSKLLAKHDLNVVAYWTGEDAPWDNSFIWVVAHSSREEAKKNWSALFTDPAFQEMIKAEQKEKLVEKVESTYMRPSDFSPIK